MNPRARGYKYAVPPAKAAAAAPAHRIERAILTTEAVKESSGCSSTKSTNINSSSAHGHIRAPAPKQAAGKITNKMAMLGGGSWYQDPGKDGGSIGGSSEARAASVPRSRASVGTTKSGEAFSCSAPCGPKGWGASAVSAPIPIPGGAVSEPGAFRTVPSEQEIARLHRSLVQMKMVNAMLAQQLNEAKEAAKEQTRLRRIANVQVVKRDKEISHLRQQLDDIMHKERGALIPRDLNRVYGEQESQQSCTPPPVPTTTSLSGSESPAPTGGPTSATSSTADPRPAPSSQLLLVPPQDSAPDPRIPLPADMPCIVGEVTKSEKKASENSLNKENNTTSGGGDLAGKVPSATRVHKVTRTASNLLLEGAPRDSFCGRDKEDERAIERAQRYSKRRVSRVISYREPSLVAKVRQRNGKGPAYFPREEPGAGGGGCTTTGEGLVVAGGT
jgi:hypothetical protein